MSTRHRMRDRLTGAAPIHSNEPRDDGRSARVGARRHLRMLEASARELLEKEWSNGQ